MASGKETVVVVAIDHTPLSKKALTWALQNLTACRSPTTRLVLLHVQSIAPHIEDYVSQDLMHAIKKHEEEVTEKIFEEAKEFCRQYEVNSPRTVVSAGDPRDGICATLESQDADLLVIGSHGYGGIFLGSVSNYCVNHAKCPVIVIKSEDPKML